MVIALNSHTTSRPPGGVTRRISARPAPGSATFRSPNEIVTASNAPSRNGSRSASPATQPRRPCPLPCGPAPILACPARSMPREKSQATASAPVAVKVSEEVPVPAASDPRHGPPPQPDLARGEDVVQQVVTPGDGVEHRRDITGLLVQVGTGHVPTLAGSEQARALPFLAQDVLGQEGEDGLVPDPGVPRAEDPVVLVREVEELGLGAVLGQVPPQPERLADRHPVVLVAVD